MSRLKSKTVIGIVAIVLGILICFIFTPLYNQSLEAKTKVVRVTKYIEKGQLISKDMVKQVEVGSYNLSKGVAVKENEVIGKYATCEMYEDENVIKDKLSVTPLAKDEYLQNLDGNKGAISITLQSFAAGLSGKLFANDIVSVLVTDDKETVIPLELKYVQVLACTTDKGDDIDEKSKSKNEDSEDNLATTVTLLVNETQAKTLANMEATQKVHLELVFRGSKEERSKYLQQQDEIIEIMKQETESQEAEINNATVDTSKEKGKANE
ncbi:Flp pilus assembly protein CpaB [Anaeromicropila herbilytica]|uniref:Flp pilus assembly protein CpaB n=1 Tax=Anaeromicropila herbilytica TaxID=2785025 RepID=A0A7R7EHW7_9FIRM|nr:RcpC/CpaB family pilus assembly protein [Anaeromicropila herbilytica]BCN29530.1 Flp pilus assembly protein CpaB [Anaeromicropila herbilytica]